MKTKLLISLIAITGLACLAAPTNRQSIFLGTSANDHTGDPARTAGQKINDNFLELYLFAQTNISAGGTATNVITYSFYNTNLPVGIVVTNINSPTSVSVWTGTNALTLRTTNNVVIRQLITDAYINTAFSTNSSGEITATQTVNTNLVMVNGGSNYVFSGSVSGNFTASNNFTALGISTLTNTANIIRGTFSGSIAGSSNLQMGAFISTGLPQDTPGNGLIIGQGIGLSDWRQSVFDAEENVSGQGYIVYGGGICAGDFSQSDGNSFFQATDGGYVGGDFSRTIASYAIGNKGNVNGDFSFSKNLGLTSEPGGYLGVNGVRSTNISIIVNSGIGHFDIQNKTNVSIILNHSVIVGSPPSSYTSNFNDTVAVISKSGTVTGFDTNRFFGAAAKLDNITSTNINFTGGGAIRSVGGTPDISNGAGGTIFLSASPGDHSGHPSAADFTDSTGTQPQATDTLAAGFASAGSHNGINLTNLNATNVVFNVNSWPGKTNVLNVNGDYQLYVMTGETAVTNLTWSSKWTTLILSNSTASTANFYWNTAGRQQGAATTNKLAIGAGKMGFVSVVGLSGAFTNYGTTSEQ